MDIAAIVAIDCLDEIALGGRPLVVDEETGALAAEMRARKRNASMWLRRASRYGKGQPWPDPEPCTSGHLRLPKAKEALDFALHAMASVLPPGTPLVVFGANDEGIRSAGKHLDFVADDVVTLVTRRHCRVILGRRRADIPGLRASLGAWRTERSLAIFGTDRRWVSYPGVFAKGVIDPATALLLGTLKTGDAAECALDFAAGTGVISAALLQQWPNTSIDMLEIDSLALTAARENVPAARGFAGRSLADAPQRHYDLIVSNPPIHEGVRESLRVLEALIADAPARLAARGELRIVVQRRIPAADMMIEAFGDATVLAEDTRFRVLSACKAPQR